jgi:hypothetical protein
LTAGQRVDIGSEPRETIMRIQRGAFSLAVAAALLYSGTGLAQTQTTDTPSSEHRDVLTRTAGQYTLLTVGALAMVGAGYYGIKSYSGDFSDHKADCDRGVYGSCWRLEADAGKTQVASTNALMLLTLGISSVSGSLLMYGGSSFDGNPSSGKRLTLELVYGTATAATVASAAFAIKMLGDSSSLNDSWDRCSDGDTEACSEASGTDDHNNAAAWTGALALGSFATSLGGALIDIYIWPNEPNAVVHSARLVPMLSPNRQGAELMVEF